MLISVCTSCENHQSIYIRPLYFKRENPGFFFNFSFIVLSLQIHVQFDQIVHVQFDQIVHVQFDQIVHAQFDQIRTYKTNLCHSPAFCWRLITYEHNEYISSEFNDKVYVSLSYELRPT